MGYTVGSVVTLRNSKMGASMNQDNPYTSTTMASDEVEPKLLHLVAARFKGLQEKPPTFLSLLVRWPGTPLRLLLGIAVAVALGYLARKPDSIITINWSIAFVSFVAGAVLRDVAIARQVQRLWPPQSHFIDWQKVEEFCEN